MLKTRYFQCGFENSQRRISVTVSICEGKNGNRIGNRMCDMA